MQICLTALGGKSPFEPVPQATSQTRSRNDSGDNSETTYSDRSTSTPAVSRPVHRVILTADGDEIAPPAEILEDNEAEPIHHRLCPCLLCAEKYRNQPPEEHHADCQCGLCEALEPESDTEPGAPDPDSRTWDSSPLDCHPERSAEGAKSKDLLFPEDGETLGFGINDSNPHSLIPNPRPPRFARAASLLSGSTNRDPLNRPWSVAEYTFGDAIRRHEAQYAARAAAALAAGIEPPPYEPFITGLIRPGTPEHAENQQMQQHSDEYWSEHFRKQIAERPDIQQYLDEEAVNDLALEAGDRSKA